MHARDDFYSFMSYGVTFMKFEVTRPLVLYNYAIQDLKIGKKKGVNYGELTIIMVNLKARANF